MKVPSQNQAVQIQLEDRKAGLDYNIEYCFTQAILGPFASHARRRFLPKTRIMTHVRR
ncbi:hypothetical protein [Glutamicibacter nicotianae]|uniref:hypothetical protein n=1 Tax=Glutamicibacter nicotianae TaxID=37929 RepID=UPI0036D3E626